MENYTSDFFSSAANLRYDAREKAGCFRSWPRCICRGGEGTFEALFPPPLPFRCDPSAVSQIVPPSAARFTASRAPTDEGLTLRMRGVIDAVTVTEFRDVVFTAMGERPRLLVLDLTQVEAVDTTGLETLVTIARVARTVNLDLSLLPSPRLLRVLAMTGLTNALPLLPLPPPPPLPGDAEGTDGSGDSVPEAGKIRSGDN